MSGNNRLLNIEANKSKAKKIASVFSADKILSVVGKKTKKKK